MHILFLGPPCNTIELAMQKAGHTIMQTEEKIDINFLSKNIFNFGVSYRYKHILRKPEIDWFNSKLVNLHISYLPWNRGADPNFWSWLDDTPKGVTIHNIDEGCDTGDILLQEYVEFTPHNETLSTSYAKLSKAVETLFIRNMEDILLQQIQPQKQIGIGTFHFSKDKVVWAYLLEVNGWKTPVSELLYYNKRGKESDQYISHCRNIR